MQSAIIRNETLFSVLIIIMTCTIPIELVSSEEYDAVEKSIQLADFIHHQRKNSESSSGDGEKHLANSSNSFTANDSVSFHDIQKYAIHDEIVIDDIEDLPMQAVNVTPLDLLGRSAVFVTKLCMQEWCELQLDFSLRFAAGHDPFLLLFSCRRFPPFDLQTLAAPSGWMMVGWKRRRI